MNAPDRIDVPGATAAHALIGYALAQAGPLPDVAPALFVDDLDRALWSVITDMRAEGEAVDTIAVYERLQRTGEAARLEGMLDGGPGRLLQHLSGLEVGAPLSGQPEAWARVLVATQADRQAATLRHAIANTALSDRPHADVFGAVRELVEAAPVAERRPRFNLLDSDAIHALPPMRWRLKELLPAEGVGAMYGHSGAGKSFVALDLVTHVAEGRDWFGYRCTGPAPVVYCALEGQAGFRKRIAAWESHNGRPIPQNLRLVIEPFKLANTEDVDALADAVLTLGDGAVTIIDTLNGAASGLDENSSADMGVILDAAKYLQRRTGGLVFVVHHTGKDLTKGLRGHSSLRAALDAAIEVREVNDRREWISEKVKDGEDGKVHGFALRRVVLGHDDDGDEITSCVIEPDEQPAVQANRPPQPRGSNQRLVLDALAPLFRESHAHGKAGAPAIRPCLRLDEAIEKIKGRMPVEPKRQGERARQAVASLIASRNLGHNEGWIWLT